MSKTAATDDDKSNSLPQDAVSIKNLLASMGVVDYEPRIVQQLLDCMYRHVSDILQDAEAYQQRLGSPPAELSMEDLLLAIQARENFTFVQPPPQSVLTDMAAKQNKQPLPELSDKPGLQIPANSLAGPSYQLTVPPDAALSSDSGGNDEDAQQGSTLRGGRREPQQLEIKLQQQAVAEGEWMDTG